MKRINRRSLLRGAIAGGSVAMGLPLLDAMIPRHASADETVAPKRILFWFTANGTLPEIWTPPASFDLSSHPIHAPLEPHKDKLIFIDGVDQEIAYNSIGDGHQTGMACLLSNAAILPGNEFCEGNCDPPVYVGWGGGQTVDQYLADEIEKDVITKFRSLELGVQVKSATVWSRLSYSAPDTPVPPREDPNQNFVDLFGDLGADPFELALVRKRRKSVLDAVMNDYQAFNQRLGHDDRIKLEKHLDAVRDLEKRLDANSVFGEACQTPSLTLPGESYQEEAMYPETGRAQMDMMVMALACDMTRVGSLQWSRSVSNVNFSSWMPEKMQLGEGHHDLSHYDDGDPGAEADLTEINRWYTEQFAYLLESMSAIPEGDGTLLDNTVVVWVNELGKGNSHARRDIPFIIAGDCQGYFNTGRVLTADSEPHGKLLVSLTHAMDKPVASFGVPQYSDGPLSGLTG